MERGLPPKCAVGLMRGLFLVRHAGHIQESASRANSGATRKGCEGVTWYRVTVVRCREHMKGGEGVT